jgi:hypothetical protein
VPTQVFSLVLDRRPTDDEQEALFGTGCADALFGMEGGLPVAEFDREAPSIAQAVVTAVRDIEAMGLRVLRVVDEDLVTLADIAERVGQSRESIRRYAAGTRGPGGFPPPVNPVREGTVFYRWSEVAPWFGSELGIEVSQNDPTLVLANLVIQARLHRSGVDDVDQLADLLTS